jgi:hypothetical protein
MRQGVVAERVNAFMWCAGEALFIVWDGERARESREAPCHLPRESSEESRSFTREPPHSGPPDPQKQRTPCDPLRPTCRPLVDPTCWSLVSLI